MTPKQEKVLEKVVMEEAHKVFFEPVTGSLCDRLRKNVETSLSQAGFTFSLENSSGLPVVRDVWVMSVPDEGGMSLVIRVHIKGEPTHRKFVVKETGNIHVAKEEIARFG